jgi:hypothetical protein
MLCRIIDQGSVLSISTPVHELQIYEKNGKNYCRYADRFMWLSRKLHGRRCWQFFSHSISQCTLKVSHSVFGHSHAPSTRPLPRAAAQDSYP